MAKVSFRVLYLGRDGRRLGLVSTAGTHPQGFAPSSRKGVVACSQLTAVYGGRIMMHKRHAVCSGGEIGTMY